MRRAWIDNASRLKPGRDLAAALVPARRLTLAGPSGYHFAPKRAPARFSFARAVFAAHSFLPIAQLDRATAF
jgi:hypothetical protein